jgi:hypothetical protein
MSITDKYVAALGEIAELKRRNKFLKVRNKFLVTLENARLLRNIKELKEEEDE